MNSCNIADTLGYYPCFCLKRPDKLPKIPRMEVSPSSPVARPKAAPAKDALKSRVTNGSALLPGVDQRTAIARRFRDIAAAILADQAGRDQCSEARLQLIRRFAASATLAEQLESKFANGEEIDVAQHALLCSTLTRLAQRIGIDRRSKNIVPTLSDYFES